MRKLLCGLFLALLFCSTAFAHPPITVYVDGQPITFDQPPIIQDDRTLVPMRAIFEALDAVVFWDEPSQTVTAVKGTDVILFRIKDTGLYKNGVLSYTMAVPAQIVNDRTLVPLRAIAESLGTGVSWDGIQYVIEIRSDGSSTTVLPDSQPPTEEEPAQDVVQNAPEEGGFFTEIKAPDGTTVLTVDLKADVLKGSEKGVEKINEAIAEEAFVQGQDFLQDYQKKALADYEKKGKKFEPYALEGTYCLMREKDGYASFFLTADMYNGKAETTLCDSYTYSLSKGKQQELEDLVTDSAEELEALWTASFAAMIDAKPKVFYDDAEKRLQKCLDAVAFYLTEDGIVFYLPPDSIAPQETGVVSFEIVYEF